VPRCRISTRLIKLKTAKKISHARPAEKSGGEELIKGADFGVLQHIEPPEEVYFLGRFHETKSIWTPSGLDSL
jgi:hypothetical protein